MVVFFVVRDCSGRFVKEVRRAQTDYDDHDSS